MRQTVGQGGGLCEENANVCLHHMLNVCVCEEERGRVLTHCPGRDTADCSLSH